MHHADKDRKLGERNRKWTTQIELEITTHAQLAVSNKRGLFTDRGGESLFWLKEVRDIVHGVHFYRP